MATNTVTSPQSGVNFSASYSVSESNPDYPGTPMAVGTIMAGTNGSAYLFVKATSNVLQGRVVIVDDNTTWTVRQITNSLARAALGQWVGVVSSAGTISGTSPGIPAGDYGWIQIQGTNDAVQFNTGSTAFTQAYTSATGVLMDTTSSAGVNAAINGIVLLETAAGNEASALLSRPTVGAAQ